MRRVSSLALGLSLIAVGSLPLTAAAGGSEFPAGGTRALGRGATGFARADDPSLMARNPALLADLWDDQAMSSAHFLFVDSCFHPTGGYGWNVAGSDVSDFGEGPKVLRAPAGATDLDGNAIEGYFNEPYPTVCYSGPLPILPTVALAKKLSPDVGVGIGFFPPDIATLNQWGRRDGIIRTEDGLRPNPARYFRSHLNVSFFSALAAAGYRMSDLLRVGFGFQWNAVAFESTSWARPSPDLAPKNDVRVQTFGRDLFIPGIVASVHVVPTDALDLALGVKWVDRVRSKAKLDLTTGVFGTGESYSFRDASGVEQAIFGSVPTTTHNQPGTVDSPPIWAPQLTLAARFSDRLSPRVRTEDWEAAHVAAGERVEDSMETERWDIEANAIVYFNSVSDVQMLTSDARKSAEVLLVDAQPGGVHASVPARVGACSKRNADDDCIGSWQVPTEFHGKTQLSLRLGGDYNFVPGLFSLRAGVSHETDGQDIEYLNVTNYMLGRTGLHAGFTLRFAGKTDFSVGFAYFIQRDVRLNPNPTSGPFPLFFSQDAEAREKYNYRPEDADGVGRLEVPYGGTDVNADGPNFVNVGSYYYDLSVLSVALSQHF